MQKFLKTIGYLFCLFLFTLFFTFISDILHFYSLKNKTVKEHSDIPIVFSGDDNYVIPITVALTSLNFHTKSKVDTFILTNGFSNENNLLLKQLDEKLNNINIKTITIDSSYFKDLPVNSQWSAGIYYRYLIPLIFNNYQKVLYLDGDILILNDLKELFNIDLTEYPLAGINDGDSKFFLNKALFKGQKDYINSGVLLINIEQFKNEVTNLFAVTDKYKNEFTHYDQDAINLVFKDKIKILPEKYNALVPLTLPLNKTIYHYAGKQKPWKSNHWRFYEWYKYQAYKDALLNEEHFPFSIYLTTMCYKLIDLFYTPLKTVFKLF